MTASAQGHHSPLVPLLAKINELLAKDDYRALADTYAGFVKEHETSRYMALEPIPFRISDYLTKKHGSSSAVTTFTLRHSTWQTEVQKALDTGADAFVALMKDIDGQVAEIASKAKKLS